MMFLLSKNVKYLRIGRANTRSANKVNFKVPCKIARIYEHSLYYTGTKLWDEYIQKSDNITLFKNEINKLFVTYRNLL